MEQSFGIGVNFKLYLYHFFTLELVYQPNGPQLQTISVRKKRLDVNLLLYGEDWMVKIV